MGKHRRSGREHASLAPLSFPEMKPVPALPGHDCRSCQSTASSKFVSVSLCWEGEGFVPGKKSRAHVFTVPCTSPGDH